MKNIKNFFFKAKITSNGNIKLGKNIGVWSVLYGNKKHYVKKLDIYVKGTCGDNCKACQNNCYVRKSYRYPSVIFGHARNTIAMRNNTGKMLLDLHNQLSKKRKHFEIIRINQSGEIENISQFAVWISLAILHPETQFYIYTKAFNVVIPYIKEYGLPKNFTVLISIWHEYGLKEFKEVEHLENIKAFVYDDNNYKYDLYDFEINTYCKAYDDNGKLNHDITCDKCKKCFDRKDYHKIIGCKAH